MARIGNPFPLFLDQRGALLDAGAVYIGTPGSDPEIKANRLDLFFDEARVIPAEQPLRTQGGLLMNGADPSFVYTAASDWSIKAKTADGETVFYEQSVAEVTVSYQPLAATLTALAALTTTAFGRSLLTLANSAALKAAAGVVDGLPSVGGTVSGDITRQGAGIHPYFADAAMTGARIFVTNGGADPTSEAGDVWLVW